MACSILCEDKIILRLSNLAMDRFYEKLMDAIIDQGLGSNSVIVKFIGEWDQDVYGLGMIWPDVCISFKNELDSLRTFIDLINIAMHELFLEKNYDDTVKKIFYDFRDEVVNFYNKEKSLLNQKA